MGRLLSIAARNLFQHRRRTVFLGGAIAGVTALLVVLVGFTHGVRQTMITSATTLMTGHVNVGGFYKVTAGQSAPVVTQYAAVEKLVRANVPDLDYLVERGRGWAKLISEEGSLQTGVGGIDVAHEPGFRKVVQVLQGRLDDLEQPGTLLMFEDQAKRLGVKVGDLLTVSAPTMRGTNNTLDLRLVAVAKNVGLMSGFNVYVPAESLRKLYQLRPDATGAILIYLKDIERAQAVQGQLRKLLAEKGYRVMDDDPEPFWQKFDKVNREEWTGQKLDVTKWSDEITFISWTLKAIQGLTGLLMFVLLVIIGVGVMNTLWIAIRERTREIGTLRAIGMPRRQVVVMFLCEAVLLGLIGTTIGALAGLGVCGLINSAHPAVPAAAQMFVMADQLHLAVQPGSVIRSALFITLCTGVAALIPSFLAARLKPVTAMHHLG